MSNEDAVAREQPLSDVDVRARVTAAGNEVQAAGLHIGESAVGDQVPPFAQPYCGKICLREVEGRCEAIEVCDGQDARVSPPSQGVPPCPAEFAVQVVCPSSGLQSVGECNSEATG